MNYSTAQGDSLFGVSIFRKFEYRDHRERNDLLKVSRLGRVGRYHSLKEWYRPNCNTVERKGEKREKFEGNIVCIFGVVFPFEKKKGLVQSPDKDKGWACFSFSQIGM